MILTTAFGFYLFYKIRQDTKHDSDQLDVALLIICLVGPLVYGMFSMFAISWNDVEKRKIPGAFSFAVSLLDIIQCLSQVGYATFNET